MIYFLKEFVINKKIVTVAKFSIVFLISGFFFFGNINSTFAAVRTWTGTTSGSWSVASNWGGTAPVTGDDLVFPGGASNLSNTNDLTENTIFNSITLSGSGYTLSGNPIILGAGLAGITDSASSGGNTIALNIRLDNVSPIFRNIVVTNTAETLTISGKIAGVGGIAKEGTGTLVLSGGNTFGGILKINAGVVNARHSTALGTIATGTEVVGGAALELQGDIDISYEALTLRGYGVDSNGALRNISGSNTYRGVISLTSAAGTEISSDSGTLTIAGGTSGSAPLVFDGAGNMVFSTTPITGTGIITKNGSGTVTFNFPNTNTGTLTINAGTILYGVNNAILSSAITVTGGTLDIASYSDMVGTVTLGTLDLAAGTITGTSGVLTSSTFTVYNGTISAIIAGDGGTLTKSTAGTVVLTRANQYTGATTVSLGILEIQDSYGLGTIDGITTVTAGATLQIDGSGLSIPEYITFSGTGHLYTGAIRNTTGNNTLTGLLTLGAAALIESDSSTTLTIDSKGISASTLGLTIGGAGNTTFTSSAPIYGTSATLTKVDAGTLTLQAFNNFTGATNFTYGDVVLSGSGAMPLSTAMTISAGASLTLDNTSATNIVDRLADALAITLNGGDFTFVGSNSIAVDETVGVLTAGIATQSGNSRITVTPGSGGSTTMQFASLTRTAGASILFRGTNLGSDPGAGVSNILFTTAPTLTGGTGAANSATIPIIQGAFGDNSPTGTGTDMVTYGRGNSNGLRLLNGAGFSGEYTTNFATTNANIKLTTATAAVTSSINSLILDGTASITNPGSAQVITLASGNILNLVSGNTVAGANTTIAAGAVEINILAPVDVDISALITTTGGLTKSGAGTLTFSTSKTYTGLTSINEGTLLAGTSNFVSSGNITVNNATLDIAGFSDTVGAVILQTGTITGTTGILTGTSYSFREGTVSAILGGAVALTRVATNTATDSVVLLTRENTYTGATTITSGILRIGAAGNGTNTPLGTTGGITTVANQGALDLNGFTLSTAESVSIASIGFGPGTSVAAGNSNMGSIMNTSGTPVSYSGAITLTAAARINADYGALTISGGISGAFAFTSGGFTNSTYTGVLSTITTLTKDGIGVLTLSNSNSFTGTTTISAGTVKLGTAGGATNTPLGTTAAATIVSAGARLDLNGFTLGAAESLTLNGVGYGLGDFASGALMNSSGSSVTYSGLITLGSSGTLIKVDSGSISLTAAGTISGATFGLILGGTGTGSLASIIGTTTGTVTKIGTGTWTLSGISTYTGATAVNNGTLKLGANSAGPTNSVLGTTGGATTVYSGGALDFNGFTLGIAEGVTINGRGVNDGGAFIGSSGTFSGAITQATDSRIANASGTLTLSAAVGGAFSLYIGGAGNITTSAVFAASALSITKQGAGTLTVTGANLYTGYTRVDAGTFAYAATTTLVATNLIMNGGTFNSGANADAIGTVTLIGGTITNSAALTGTSYTFESGTISGILAGAIAVTKNTNNTVTMTGVNTISSTITINAGTLTFSGAGTATAVTGVTVNLGGTLTLDNSTTASTDRLNGTANNVTLALNGGNFNFIGNTAAAASETMGAMTAASGHSTVTITPGAGGSTTMTFASFARTAGATILFRGTSLGSTAAANVSTLLFTAAPTLTGAAGAANSATISVIKGAFGDNSLSGTGTDMVTYNVGNTNGIRRLNATGFTGEYSAVLAANTNVKLTAGTAASTVSINSLILNGFDITNPGSAATVTMASASLSGNILINSANNIAGANTTIGITTFELDILATANSTVSAIIGTATTGSVVLSGTGNVTLSAANLYTSTTFINSATLTAGASNVLSSGGVTIVGGTYNLNGNSDTVGAISINAGTITTGAGTLTGNGTFSTVANNNAASIITGNLGLGANATFTINDGLMDNDALITAVISGAFTFGKAGAGVLELAGSNTFSGVTTISAGILRLGATGDATNTPLGTVAGSTNVSTASAALDLNGFTLGTAEPLTLTGNLATGALQNTSSSSVNYSGLITLGAASTIISNYGDINITNTGTISGATFGLTIGGAGNGSLSSILGTTSGTLTKNGLGVWTASGLSTYTGVTTISAGTFKLGAAGSGTNTPLGTSAGGVSITSGAIFDLNGFTLGTSETATINGTGIASIGAFINSSNNTISYNGALTMGAASRIVNYGTGVLTLTGAITGNFALTTVAVGGITQSTASVWSGTGSLIKEGSGTLILSGQNSTTGAMTVSTGKLQLGASGGAANTPLGTNAGGVTVAAGAALDFSTFSLGGASTYETLNVSGSGISNTGALIFAASTNNNFGAMTVAANTRIINSGSGTVIFGGVITAANGINLAIRGTGPTNINAAFGATATTATLTKWDSGILSINAVSITTGLIRVNGGTLKYGIADALATPAVTVAGGTWDLNGFSEGGTTLIGAVTLIGGSIVNTGGAATITSSATYTVESGTISAVLAGAAIAMNKNTGGTVTLSAANTFAGLTTINAGTLAWGINDALSSGALTVTGGTANLGTSTDTVGAVTLTSGFISSSTGVLTGTAYTFSNSGTVSAILAGSIGLTKTGTGTVSLLGSNTYTGTTTITAGVLRANSTTALGDGSATNTLVFNGGTLRAGGNISSPSGRAVTLTSTGLIDTNNYTVTLAGTIGSASGITKNGMGTLSTTGAVTLGAALTVNNGTFDQASSLSGPTAVTIATSGVWSNVGTGAVTLAGAVVNSGVITLNSNNGTTCIDGPNSILVRSSITNTLRAWSGTGIFNMQNLDVDDMTGAGVTVYNSTLSGDTTWTVGSCGVTVSGSANGNNAATVKLAINGTLQGSSTTISSSSWSLSSGSTVSAGDIITVWVDGVADNLESTAVTKYASGNITGMVLDTNVLTIGSNQNTSVSTTNLAQYEATDDEDVMHTSVSGALLVQGGSNSYTDETLSILASNTLTVNSSSTESITTEKITNAGTITASGTPTISLAGTSGTLFTNTGTFTAASSTVDLTGNGSATIASGTPTFYNLTSSGTGTKSLGEALTVTNILTVGNGTLDTTTANDYTINAGKIDFAGTSSSVMGYNTIAGSNTGTYISGNMLAQRFTASSSGTISQISVYLVDTGPNVFKVAVYSDNAGAPDTLLATSAGTGSSTTTPSWQTAAISLSVTSGVSYWFAVLGAGNLIMNYDVVGSGNKTADDGTNTYPTFNDPFNVSNYYTGTTVSIYADVTGSSGGTLKLNDSTVNVSGTGTVFDATGGTMDVSTGTSTIKLTDSSSSSKTFAGAGKTYDNLWIAPGSATGSYTISGDNTFLDFKDDGTGAHAINFTAGSTTTISTLTLDTNATQLITLQSTTPTSYWNLVDTSGTNTVSYVSITDSCASGGATWDAGNGTNTNGGHNCGWSFVSGITITGSANGNNTATVKVAVNGTLNGATTTIASSAWTLSGVSVANNDIITVWVDNVADNLESTAVTKYGGSGNITGMVLNTNVLTIGSNQNNSVSTTNLAQYEATDDEDVMHTSISGALLVQGGSNSYTDETLSVLASNTLTVNSSSTESITTEKIINAGTITASGTPLIEVNGTSGTLYTNTGTFTPASSTVNFTGNGTATLNSGTSSFYNLKVSGSGTKTLGAAVTAANNLEVQTGTLDTSSGSSYTVTAGKINITGGAGGTFGETSVLGSSNTTTKIITTRFTATATGVINKLTARVFASSGTVNMRAALYSKGTINSQDGPVNLLTSSPYSVSLSITDQWLEIPLNDYTVTNGVDYYFAIWGDATFGLHYDYNAGTYANRSYEDNGGTFPAWVNPITSGNGTHYDTIGSYYVTYVGAGTLVANGSTINVTGTSGTLFTKDSSGTFTAGTSTVNLTGNGSATINSGDPSFYNLTSSGTGTKSLGGALTATNTLTVSGGTFETTGSNHALNAGKIVFNSGTLNLNASTVNLSGTSGTLFTKTNGVLNAGTSTVNLNGNGSATVASGAPKFYNLNSSGTGTKSLGELLDIGGTLTVSNGTFDTTGSNYGINAGKIAMTGTAGVLGYQTIGTDPGSPFSRNSGTYDFQGGQYVAPNNGTVTSMSAWVKSNSGSSMNFKFGIQRLVGTDWVKVAESSSVSGGAGGSPSWVTASISASLISGETYFIQVIGDAPFGFYYDGGLAASYVQTDGAYSSFAVPSSQTDSWYSSNWGWYTNYANTIYADYVYGGGTLAGNSSVINLTGTGNLFDYLAGTVSLSSATVKLTDQSSTAKTFNGAGKTFGTLWINGSGTGEYTINGSNTFTTFKVDTPPHTIKFTAGTTTTVTDFDVNGNGAASLVTLKSTVDTSSWTLSKATGTLRNYYLSIRDSIATGGATFLALNSTNVSGNTGWQFFEFSVGGGGSVESSANVGSCADGQQNGDETGVDTGGRCSGGGGAGGDTTGTCADGIQNGDETGTDTGGRCSGYTGTCADGIQNGNETGTDTGGRCSGGGGAGGGGGDLGYIKNNRTFMIASAAQFNILNLFKYLLAYI